MAAKVNPDLARARAEATFDPLELAAHLCGGPEKLKRKRFLREFNSFMFIYQD